MTYRSFLNDKNKIRGNFDAAEENKNEIIDQDRINLTIDGKIASIQPVQNNFKHLITIETDWSNMEITSIGETIFLLKTNFELTFTNFNLKFLHTIKPEILNRVGSGNPSGDNLNFKVQSNAFHLKQIIFDIKNESDNFADVAVVASLFIGKPFQISNLPPYQAKLTIQLLNPDDFV